MKKLFLLLLVCLTVCYASLERLEVNVVDSSGRPVQGAAVVFSCTVIDYNQEFPPPSYLPTMIPFNRTVKFVLDSTDKNGIASDYPPYVDCGVGLPMNATVTYQGMSTNVSGTFKGAPNSLNVIMTELYDLRLYVVDRSSSPLKNVEIVATPTTNPEISRLSGKTDGNGTITFKQIPNNAEFLVWLKSGTEEKSVDVRIDGNTNLNVMMDVTSNESMAVPANASNGTAPPPANAGTPSKDWFIYLLDETDRLILDQKMKHPKLQVVFVPVGYADNESEEFKALAEKAVQRLATVSPFRECGHPVDNIEVSFIEPAQCNVPSCSDDCGQWDTPADNCQLRVTECSRNVKHFDFIVGLCKNTSCGGNPGGCAAGVPAKSVVVNTAEIGGATAEKVVSHELGHALGLYHINSPVGTNGCWGGESWACKEPNAADCYLPDDNRSRDIMAYCPLMEAYGPAAYAFLRNTPLHDYMEVCK